MKMRNKKSDLDEMQIERRNNIGNQMFMLMFWALFLNNGLHGAGITWLPYPANVMVIISACMGIYLVRLIAANAYLSSKAQNRKGILSLVMAIIFSIALAVLAVVLFKQSPVVVAENPADNSALILFTVSAVGLLAALITAVIKKVNNRNDEED
jgi:ABC-type methionine transport system permease subunit